LVSNRGLTATASALSIEIPGGLSNTHSTFKQPLGKLACKALRVTNFVVLVVELLHSQALTANTSDRARIPRSVYPAPWTRPKKFGPEGKSESLVEMWLRYHTQG
jgi:hypothetical protein